MIAAVATDDLDLAFAEAGNVRPRQGKKESGGAGAADGPPPGFTVDVGKLGPSWLPNGYYTLTFPCGSHRTLRVYTQQNGLFAGRRLAALLIGPDRSKDTEDFAFVVSSGPKVWKRFRGHKQEEYIRLLWDLAQGEEIEGHKLLLAKKCLICNRDLTTPESHKLGIGPICYERVHSTGSAGQSA